MQLVFTIHVIITLLMLKPATSKTCENTAWNDKQLRWALCPQNNMYLTELTMEKKTGKCCEVVDPSYANQHTTCSSLGRRYVYG